MAKIVYRHEGLDGELSALIEGYLYGLGEVCHTLFGAQGEAAMYQAIGGYFLHYLDRKMNIVFREHDPWRRYCRIVEFFTRYGFYSYVELEQIGDDSYWMLESGQYAGEIWEEQQAWERGTPPCPLWSVISFSLAEIDYRIVLDTVEFDQEAKGYQSTFHFEKNVQRDSNVIERAKTEIKRAMLPICSNCKKIRDENGTWQDLAGYFRTHFDAHFTHGICPACKQELYPELYATTPRTRKQLVTGDPQEWEAAIATYALPAFGGGAPVSGPGERRSGRERRSGSDRRKRVQRSGIMDLRSGTDRRSGLDRRIAAA
jgi:hypothetical protein